MQAWYPAVAAPSSARAPYMQEADTVTEAFARIHGRPSFLFHHFKYATTNAMTAACIADGQSSHSSLRPSAL